MSLTEFRLVPPNSWVEAVVIGTMAWSSWSEVVDDEPDEPTVLSTPMTCHRHTVDGDGLAHGVPSAEQLLGGGRPQHHHVGPGASRRGRR